MGCGSRARSFRRQAVDVERDAYEEQDERDGHDVRVHIAKEEAEEREFLYRIVNVVDAVEGVDDAAGVEPPPEVGRRPALRRHLGGAVQAVDAYPVVEALRTHAVETHELQHALKVGDDAEEQGRSDARDDCITPARPIQTHHVDDQAEYAGRRQRGNERHSEVVGNVGGDGGQSD